MGALDAFFASGVRFELLAGDQIRAIGTLNEAFRAEIKAQKTVLIDELKWLEFERLLVIVAPAYRTPAHELQCRTGQIRKKILIKRKHSIHC